MPNRLTTPNSNVSQSHQSLEAPEASAERPVHQAGARTIVGIGASAGGLDALERLFNHLSDRTGLSYVVIQHLSPDFDSMMDQLLSRHTGMNVAPIKDQMRIERNRVYLNPPKMDVEISGGRFVLKEQDKSSMPQLPIDAFFKSLAESEQANSIAVVLSGTGSDGSRGIVDVSRAGGLVIVQDTNSADFDGMPKAALASGVADIIARPEAIPEWIARYMLAPGSFPRGNAEQPSDNPAIVSQDPETAAIFRMFRQKYSIDFSYYRASTISRRLERRIQMSGCDTLAEYLPRLNEDPREMDLLYRDLLVEVTQFFRDPDGFRQLTPYISEIIENAGSRGEVRVWVPGCATGEEAYSLAMLLDDCANKVGSEADIKVFATDVHPTSLEIGGSGVYAAKSMASVPEDFKEKYFERVGELFHIKRGLRQMVVFAPHDITSDPPFTRIDLISCRNVLIYLESVIQQKVLSLFHFGMNVNGILYLGPSETLGPLENEFEMLERHWKIFRKVRNVRLHDSRAALNSPMSRTINRRPSFISTATRLDRNWVIPEAHESLLQRYVPPSVLVNEHHEVIHSFGDAHRLLVQPGGRMTLDVTKLLSKEMGTALIAGLVKAANTGQPVVFKRVIADTPEGQKYYDLSVESFAKAPDKLFLVTFQPCDVAPPPVIDEDEIEYDPSDMNADRIRLLERELAYTKETLQATVEELETSNEELQSTNEELVASNEELQSTNEELHSVNEELHTVNTEHQRKIDELTHLTADMDTMLRCSSVGTIFLDRELRIRKFTPAACELFHVIDQDVGRPIEHIAHKMEGVDIMETIRPALHEFTTIENDIHGTDGNRYLIRCMPNEVDNAAGGVVLTFVSLGNEYDGTDGGSEPG